MEAMIREHRMSVTARLALPLLILALPLVSLACATVNPSPTPSPTASLPSPPATADAAVFPTLELTEADLAVGYLCPMHPDHTSEEAGECPICGMDLVLGRPWDMRDYRLEFWTEPSLPKAGEPLTLNFAVFAPDSEEPVRDYELVHDMPYHLFVISQDMEFFQHIHPEQADDLTWSIDVELPKPGAYAVLSDFLPSGGSAQFMVRPLVTAGYDGDLLDQAAQLVLDTTPTQTLDHLSVSVSYDPPVIRAGSYGHLVFHLTDSETGEPVTDLQQYLAAFGHMLIMDEEMIDYVHAHPIELASPGLSRDQLQGGPEVIFEGLMPKPGRYRAWTQFLYKDKLHTFVNTFEVYEVGQRVR